nr:zinc finger, CCHC-type [Tanacetum cinerariifolium]
MTSMNTRLNIKKLDGNIIQKHRGAQEDRETKGFHVSNDDIVVAQRRLEDKQPEVKETNVTLLANVCCFLIQSGLSKVLWVEDTTSSTYLVNRSPSSAIGFKKPIDMNTGFNESEEYKKTFIGSGVGLQEVQTQELMDYQLARDRDQACELFLYREDNNEAAFAVVVVEKIYAHELLTLNNKVACEAEIWATKGLLDNAKGNILGMKIITDQSGNTLRVSQSRFYNGKLVHILLKGHSILLLKGSLSRDCDMKKNGKWSCIYAVGSREYQMVCTRLDIASADVGMLDKFDRGLQTNVQVFVDFDYAMERSITVMGDCDVEKNGKWSCIYAVRSQEYHMVYTRLDTASVDVVIES